MPKQTLSELQAAAKIRHEGGLPLTDFTKLDIFKKKEENIKRVRRHFKERWEAPDEKKVIVRPPAVYSNSSPYGIADELLRGK